MFSKVSSFFKNSKDKRIKFNFHMGSFFVLNIAVLSIFYIYSKIFLEILDIKFLYSFVFTYYVLFLSGIISYIFSMRTYYWYYQRDLLNEVFSENLHRDFSILSNKEKYEIILIVTYKIFPYLLMSSFLLIVLLNKKIFDDIDFSIIFLFNLAFEIFLIRNFLKKIDYKKFKEIKYNGIMTNYSESAVS